MAKKPPRARSHKNQIKNYYWKQIMNMWSKVMMKITKSNLYYIFIHVSRQFENTKSVQRAETTRHAQHWKSQRILLTRRLSVHACSLHSINRQWFGWISPRLMQSTTSSLIRVQVQRRIAAVPLERFRILFAAIATASLSIWFTFLLRTFHIFCACRTRFILHVYT